MSDERYIICDNKQVEVSKLIWCEGTPFDPSGYYMIVKFKRRNYMVFLTEGGKPNE